MKRWCIVLNFLIFVFAWNFTEAQINKTENEGAREAELNADPHPQDEQDIQTHDPQGNYENNEASNIPAGTDVTNDGNESGAETNTPGVNVRTTSPSGSPAVPMEGDERDGTNTVQSARPNIAGSPVPGGSTARENRESSKNNTQNATLKKGDNQADEGKKGKKKRRQGK
jgi:hypothetical protein